jgi:predicted AlkP superfamily phosphohydrolase/phosphomutase
MNERMVGDQVGLRTLLIGIDSACRSVLEPQFEQDRLPHLQQLLGNFNYALTSQIPPWTASAWPSMYTGTNPGKHGVFDFLSFDGYEWDIVNATHVQRRSLWEYLGLHGYRSVVVNVPVTHPPRPFDGALIPGYTAPESPTCHPQGLLSAVERAIDSDEYRVYGDVESALDCIRMRGDALRYLTERFDPDFGFVQFQWTDTICHERPGDWSALKRVYSAVDEQIGTLIEECNPQNVFVVSDHGIGPYEGHSFLVNEFLREQGYVRSTNGGNGMPSWAGVRDAQLKQGMNVTRDLPVERLAANMARIGLTSQRIGRVLGKLGLDDIVLRCVPTTAVSAATEQVDFPRSRAYMRSRTELGIRINLADREPEGIVPESEYEQVRSDLIRCLSRIETPAGEPVFESVVRRERHFDGPEADRAVDVVTVPSRFDQFLSTRLDTRQFDTPDEPWNHKRNGLIAARGTAIDETTALDSAHLFDVAPTVLATFDIPADVAMDGKTLPIVESVGEQKYPAFEPDDRLQTENRAIEERLSDLGYID